VNWPSRRGRVGSGMPRFQRCSLRKDRAVSTIIGGLIMLTLILSALGTMIFVSEQYDQYQQIDSRISQYQYQQISERLVINSPGLTALTSAGAWGSGCVSTYNCYNITVSNFGGEGVQIVRIYINSTGQAGQGCNPKLCILNPTSTIANYAFNQANQFLNPGEVDHAIVIALPSSITLPSPTPAVPQNSVMLVTGRGNVFSFQWPFQTLSYGQSQSAFSSGIMKVAYQCTSTSNCSCSSTSGCDSMNEPLGGTKGATYCHTEPLVSYPAPSYDAEQLGSASNPIYLSQGVKVGDGGVLTFVNPWITNTILESAQGYPGGSPNTNATQLYIYVNVINTSGIPYSPVAGSIDFTWYGQDHIDGVLIGAFYKGQYYLSTQTMSLSIASGASYYAIFHINIVKLGNWNPNAWTSGNWALPIMWWGSASITNDYDSASQSGQFFTGSILLSGLWIRSSC